VPTCDLGNLGPAKGESVPYTWRWHFTAPRYGLWGVLVLALAVPSANRRRDVLWILVPLLPLYLMWEAAGRAFGLSSLARPLIGGLILSLANGLVILWLLGHVIARCSRRRALILVPGVLLAVILAGALSIRDLSEETGVLASLLGVLLSTSVLAYLWAGRMSRRAYRPRRFVFWLAVGTMAFSTIGSVLWFLVGAFLTGPLLTNPLRILMIVPVVSVVLGGCALLISLPLALVGLHSPLFRSRLFACLKLPCESAPAHTTADRGPAD
jgi:hypothetical protein